MSTIFDSGFFNSPLYTFAVLILFSFYVLAKDCRRWGWSLRPSNVLMLLGSFCFLFRWPQHPDLNWSDSFVILSTILVGLAYMMRRWERDSLKFLDEYGSDQKTPILSDEEVAKLRLLISESASSPEEAVEPTAETPAISPGKANSRWTIVYDNLSGSENSVLSAPVRPPIRNRTFQTRDKAS